MFSVIYFSKLIKKRNIVKKEIICTDLRTVSAFYGLYCIEILFGMCVGLLAATLAAVAALSGRGYEDDILNAVMRLEGVASEEELNEDVLDDYGRLLARPVEINGASISEMVSSGLFSRYQAASIVDYRERNGEILTVSELAVVDGIGEDYAVLLSPFIRLESSRLPGERKYRDCRVRAVARVSWKDEFAYASKLSFRYGGFGMNAAVRSGGPEKSPELTSACLGYSWRGEKVKLLLGDFNARFGQGLVFWSGMTLNDISSPASMVKKNQGISPSVSYSPVNNVTGVASELRFGRFIAASFAGVSGFRKLTGGKDIHETAFVPGLNLTWLAGTGHISCSCFAETAAGREKAALSDCKFSVDGRFSIRGVDVFSELACDVLSASPAGLAGCGFNIAGCMQAAFAARFYPAAYSSGYGGAVRSGSKCSNEHGLSFAAVHVSDRRMPLKGRTGFGSSAPVHRAAFGADLSCRPEPSCSTQFNARFIYEWRISPSMSAAFRCTGRLRDYSDRLKTGARLDLCYDDSRWKVTVRTEAVRCRSWAFLNYAECGFMPERFSLWMRTGVFRIDEWSDRIYAYERDAPGSFNVPAYYGRGFWAALYGGARIARMCRIWVRCAHTSFIWSIGKQKDKPGRTELKFQLELDL